MPYRIPLDENQVYWDLKQITSKNIIFTLWVGYPVTTFKTVWKLFMIFTSFFKSDYPMVRDPGILTSAIWVSGPCPQPGGSPHPRSDLLNHRYLSGRLKQPPWPQAPKYLPHGSKRAMWPPPLRLRWERQRWPAPHRSERKRDGRGNTGSRSRWPSAELQLLLPECRPVLPLQQEPLLLVLKRYCLSSVLCLMDWFLWICLISIKEHIKCRFPDTDNFLAMIHA